MDFVENQDRTRILIKSTSKREQEFLRKKFPGTMPTHEGFAVPNSLPVLFNIYNRIKKRFPKSRTSRYVSERLQEEFKLKDLPESFSFHTEPLTHQLIALRYLYTVGRGGLLLDPGLGKTKVVLDFAWLLRAKRTLVVCPKALLFVWEEEIPKHRPELSVHVVTSTDWKQEVKNGLLEKNLVVVNYEKAVILQAQLKALQTDLIAVDEALIKNPHSQRTKALMSIRAEIPYRVIMSGTLVTQSPLDAFAPVKFLEPALVGTSFGKFRDTYTHRFKVRKPDGQTVTISGNPKQVHEVRDILASCSVIMTKEEWLKDLPPKKWFFEKVQMGDVQREKYLELSSNYITETPLGFLEADSPLTLLGKLLQVVNGFAYIQEDDSLEELQDSKPGSLKKTRKTYFFPDQPKLDKLRSLLTGILKDRKVVVWFNMTAEHTLLSGLLESLGISFVSIKGGEKRIGEKVQDFNHNPETRILLVQAKSLNYGATLLGDNENVFVFKGFETQVYTHVFYSRNFSLEIFLQQQDRSHRIGLKRSPEYYVLSTNSSIEQKLDEALMTKQVLKETVLVDIMKSLRQTPLAA